MNPDVVRYQRYERIVKRITERDEFRLADLKAACSDEKPAFVTRVVREMEKDGYLERFGPVTNPSYRWRFPVESFGASQWLDSRIYGARLKRTPAPDRPRERLLANGAESLRAAELLAILIRSGRPGESALQAGEKVAARFSDELNRLADAGRGELKSVSSAIEVTAYCQIMAGIELGRRVAAALSERKSSADDFRVRGVDEALDYCQREFARLAAEATKEEFHLVTLDTKHHIIGRHQLSVGLLDESLIHPREVFRPAIKDAASAILLVHNHPSGDPTPSAEDLAITRQVSEAGKMIGIEFLDHIIVGRHGSASLREQGGF